MERYLKHGKGLPRAALKTTKEISKARGKYARDDIMGNPYSAPAQATPSLFKKKEPCLVTRVSAVGLLPIC